ncbi:hypothetical protein [Oleiphilus messinensis]|nr:hypothetical protein [Oleiphilus messinensis]
MKFQTCLENIGLTQDEKEIIDACLQALSLEVSEYTSILNDLASMESSGIDVACIYLDNDSDDCICQKFEGVCFTYLDEYATVSRPKANHILNRSIEILDLELDWKGIQA